MHNCPSRLAAWRHGLWAEHGSPWAMAAVALLVFPKLAMGLSGFETGVAVMPLVKGDRTDTEENPKGRIRNTKKLLFAAALIMSVMLIASSFVTTLLIPADAFRSAVGDQPAVLSTTLAPYSSYGLPALQPWPDF